MLLRQEPSKAGERYEPFEQLPPDDCEGWLQEQAEEVEGELQRRQAEVEQHEARKAGSRRGAATAGGG